FAPTAPPEPAPPEPAAAPEPQPKDAAPPTAITSNPPPEAWWPGAASERTPPSPAVAYLEPSLPTKTGTNVTPEHLVDFGSIVGRLCTVLVGLLLLVAAYPGWLQPTGATSVSDFRASWEITPNVAYRQMAEWLAETHKQGKLPASAKAMP